ncbi:hypothetical protein DFH09DRAFT_1325389 [Mycena vulgaris]|nr:hypothetical protein DFH09DRAFT_1325389 [Mycena vulgaris]
MSTLSLSASFTTDSLGPAADCTRTFSPPTIMVTPLEPHDEDSRIELHEVHLPDRRPVYHIEVWHGSHPPTVMKYENIDTLEVYTLYLAPLSRREVVTNPDGALDHEFKVVLPPCSTQKAATKLISDVNPHFTGHHSTTHHDAASTLRAPSAFNGVAVVAEKVAESMGWTLPELHCEGPIRSAYALAHQRGCDGLDMTQSLDLDYKNPHLDIPPGISLTAPLPAGIHLVQHQPHPQRPLPSGSHITPMLQASSQTRSHGISHTYVSTARYDQDPTGLRRSSRTTNPPDVLNTTYSSDFYKIQALPMGILRDMPSERPVSSHSAHEVTTTELPPDRGRTPTARGTIHPC